MKYDHENKRQKKYLYYHIKILYDNINIYTKQYMDSTAIGGFYDIA